MVSTCSNYSDTLDNDLFGTADVDASHCYRKFSVTKWHHGVELEGEEKIAQEIPVALVYNGVSHVVMMATPNNLEDLALGFSLSEGIVDCVDEFHGIDSNVRPQGIELHIEISTRQFVRLKQWRRNQTGRTGCGLCGTESLQQAVRELPSINGGADLRAPVLQQALAELDAHQPLQYQTGASHCAAWYQAASGHLLMLREDVGRHNALDKLIGGLKRQGTELSEGFALISSRASYEMVAKSCHAGIGSLVAVSAPTALAVDMARQAGLTLIGFARPGRFIVYNQPGKNI